MSETMSIAPRVGSGAVLRRLRVLRQAQDERIVVRVQSGFWRWSQIGRGVPINRDASTRIIQIYS